VNPLEHIRARSRQAGDAFAFANGHAVDLSTLIPAGSGVKLDIADGISNNGVIAGTATLNGSRHSIGFVLTPVS
jgi:hypothetical protein